MSRVAGGGATAFESVALRATEAWRGQAVTTTRCNAAGLMPPGCGLTIPLLQGVPLEHQLWPNQKALARLGSTLLEADIARPGDWVAGKRNPLAFIEGVLDRWLARNHRNTIGQHFFLNVTLCTNLDRYTSIADGENGICRAYLAIEPESAGYVVVGPTLRRLEAVHPRLPATFAHLFLSALDRWVRVYDYRAAQERIEVLREWAESDADAEELELPDIEGAIPEAMRKRPLSARTVRRLIAANADPFACRLMEGTLQLDCLSKLAKCPVLNDTVRELLMDCGEAVPALVAVFEENDAIEGAFDEERHGMLELTPEPNVLIPFRGQDAGDTAEAFRVLGILCGTLAAASELIGIMPGQPNQTEKAR